MYRQDLFVYKTYFKQFIQSAESMKVAYRVMKPLIENRRQKCIKTNQKNLYIRRYSHCKPLFIKMPLYIPHLTDFLSKRRFSTSTNIPNQIKVQPSGVEPKSKQLKLRV